MLTSGFQNCQISELIFRGQNVYGSTRLDKRNTIVLDLLLYHEKQGSYWQKTIRLRRLLSVRPVAKIAAVSTPVLLTPWYCLSNALLRQYGGTVVRCDVIGRAAPLQRGARGQPSNDVTQQSAQNVNKSPGVATALLTSPAGPAALLQGHI